MKSLYKALADFQQVVPHIYKGTSGYNYKYADWGQILDIVNPLLKKHGLGFTQLLDGTNLKTVLFHVESGETIEASVYIPQDVELQKMNTFQVIGSGITYYRRYSLSAILGLVTDEDADASGEQVRPKPTTVIRDRAAEQAEAEADILTRAKKTINETLEAHDYIRADSKKTFIKGVLSKTTIDTIDDADLVMDALENEA
jgi:hypothetical protein